MISGWLLSRAIRRQNRRLNKMASILGATYKDNEKDDYGGDD
tara:strand:+ start:1801 stop:1926 length:126 start_codon:yes stop_codon:yes gene_type:complete